LSNYTNGLSTSDKELSYRVSKLSLADGTVPFVFPPPDTPRAKRRLMVLANETFPESDDWGSAGGSVGQGESAIGNNPTNNTTTQFLKDARRNRVPIVYIASDNPASANQMNQTAAWPLTYISPKGCHVSSKEWRADILLCWAAIWDGSGVLTLESRLLTDFVLFPPSPFEPLIPPLLGRDGQICRLQPAHDGLLAVARHQRYHRAPERRWWLAHQRF
jgi:hypothetical protein